jgi:hypothetical protein
MAFPTCAKLCAHTTAVAVIATGYCQQVAVNRCRCDHASPTLVPIVQKHTFLGGKRTDLAQSLPVIPSDPIAAFNLVT